jgi:protein involved in polysaccharide export with SLBB domain
MISRKVISLLLIFSLLAPTTQGWGQKTPDTQRLGQKTTDMEDQARFYLQKIVPSPDMGRLQEQKPQPSPTPTPEPAQILTTAPRQPEEVSAVEKRAEANGMPVKQFGYSFFYKPPETFLPVQNIPVGPDYIIGPGDTLHIMLWGSVQYEYNITVDRNGTISIPKVGVVHVSGLSYRQLREVMDKEFSRQYTNFQMNVTLDTLRTIQVFVVGQARFPGTYAVSSLSTLISALFASGGPSKSGSMRDIQVRRGKRVIVHFDMYDFLLRGDKSKDIRLQSEDVIFIPPIGPMAAIGSPKIEYGEEEKPRGEPSAKRGLLKIPGKMEFGEGGKPRGEPSAGRGLFKIPGKTEFGEGERPQGEPAVVGGPIKIPGIYEIKNERTVTDLLRLAGGLADTAYKGRMQVLRIKAGREMVLFEDDLGKVLAGRSPDISLVDGDLVKIFPVSDLVEKKVRVAGAVKNPGEFGLRDSMRVKDLVTYAGGLLMEANRDEAEITRVTITSQGPETTRLYINPQRALNDSPKDNILLKPNDYVFFRTVPEWDLYKLVEINGEVKFPGTYAVKSGETLSSLLSRAGGFSAKAYPKGTIFTRQSVKEIQEKQLKQAIDRIETEMYSIAAQKAQTEIEPEEAKAQQVVVKQQQLLVKKLREIVPLGRVVIRLNDPERLRGTPEDIELQKGDSLLVPSIQQTVNVLGSVANPTGIVYEPYLTVADYIARAGGATKTADVKGTYVIKVNGSAVSRSAFKWYGGRVWGGPSTTYHLGGFNSLRLDPGDTIVIPEELERVAWLREIKDIATIIGQIALTAGVVLVGLK